jgi:hypothetical protein
MRRLQEAFIETEHSFDPKPDKLLGADITRLSQSDTVERFAL